MEKYVKPALRAGQTTFSIAVKDLLRDLVASGFPPGNTPQVCTAIRKETFLKENGLEIEEIAGPPSKQSTTVVVRYRVVRHTSSNPSQTPLSMNAGDANEETAEAKALRLTEGLRGLLKEEMAAHGGAEGFLRWVRGYDEEDAA